MSKYGSKAWIHSQTLFVRVGAIQFAYRRLGPDEGTPVLFLNHWGANLDNFDPRIMDGLSAGRPVYALDYRGIGRSGGNAPLTVLEMATDVLAVAHALQLQQFDIVGFSLGGFVAQQVALLKPTLVRKLILAGTGPAGGAGINRVGQVSWPLILKAMILLRDPKYYLFFTTSSNGRKAAKSFLSRLKERTLDRDKPVTPKAFKRQLDAIKAWGNQQPQDLGSIKQPTLIVNGDNDIMVPSENSENMARRIPAAELVLYPDAGHGGHFQFHDAFVSIANRFLTGSSSMN